mmetsp:Transcript_70776/g.160091  ORF Transcript_70776/g.160091 Transcript_70776/m.160091 type:complete len:137 (-) Transcript_70776:332-742(-)
MEPAVSRLAVPHWYDNNAQIRVPTSTVAVHLMSQSANSASRRTTNLNSSCWSENSNSMTWTSRISDFERMPALDCETSIAIAVASCFGDEETSGAETASYGERGFVFHGQMGALIDRWTFCLLICRSEVSAIGVDA